MEAPRFEESPRVLVVDDEKVIREILSDFLTMEGYQVATVEDGATALEEMGRRHYNMVISDLKMPGMGGLELLEHIAEADSNTLAVIMTGFGTVETAIEAMKKGAYDYILKPFKIEEVIHIVERGLDRQRLQAENMKLREALSLYKISEAIAQQLSLERVLDLILDGVVAETDADVCTLHLRDPKTGEYIERHRRTGKHGEPTFAGQVSVKNVLDFYRSDKPLLAHGPRSHQFFSAMPSEKNLVSFCSIPLKVRDQVIGMLNAYSCTTGHKFSEGQRKMLAVLAARAAVSIENAQLYEDVLSRNEALTTVNMSMVENFRATIIGFAHALEESDKYTRGHSDRVSFYSSLTARALTLSEPEVERVVQAGLMHDIGKIGIRSEKLNKPGKLTPEEVAMFRTHPAKGKRILEPMPSMIELIPGAWCHHENWDGSGYPQGLMGDNIPLLGRIVAIADTYDAMTSDRAYRKALPHDVAIAELERCSGAQFDPELVQVFIRKIEAHREDQVAAGNQIPR